MTILEIKFPGGLEIDPAVVDDIQDLVTQNVAQAEFIQHAPGTKKITPPEWTNPAFDYILHVLRDGTGSMELIPRYHDSVAYEPDPKDFSIQADPLKTMSSMIKPINQESGMFVLAGGHPIFEAALFSLFLWIADRK